MKRLEVYRIIDEEREYQEKKWGENKINSIEEWLVYMEDYINEAKHIVSRDVKENTAHKCMWNIRKIAAMAVCAMEQYDTMSRNQEETYKSCLEEE